MLEKIFKIETNIFSIDLISNQIIYSCKIQTK